jgi:hypothetical protein
MPFRVARQEDNFIANDEAQRLGPKALNEMWIRLSANCPNYQAAESADERNESK